MQPIQNEVAVLRRIGQNGMASGAFGCDYSRAWVSDEMPRAKSWFFEITERDGQLEARVDLYSATWQRDGGEFDCEQWKAMILNLNASATRKGFRALSSLCRSLMANLVTTLTNQHGTYHMDLEGGVTFFRADGRVTVQSWEEFLEVAA